MKNMRARHLRICAVSREHVARYDNASQPGNELLGVCGLALDTAGISHALRRAAAMLAVASAAEAEVAGKMRAVMTDNEAHQLGPSEASATFGNGSARPSRRDKKAARKAAARAKQAAAASTAAALPNAHVAVAVEPQPIARPAASAPPSVPGGPKDWPLPLRILSLVLVYLLFYSAGLWALLLSVFLLLPMRLLRAPHGALRTARRWAQRPLLTLAVPVSGALCTGDDSFGLDFARIHPRPTSIEALLEQARVRGVVAAVHTHESVVHADNPLMLRR